MARVETELELARPVVGVSRFRAETLLLLGSAAVILAAGGVLTVLVRGQDLLPGEMAITRWLGTIDNSVILAISEFLDVISNFDVAPLLFLALIPVVWFAWGRRALILFGISGSLTALTRVTNLADRARPTDDLMFEEIVAEAGVYPSGHVVYGVMVFGMIAYLAFKHMRPGIWRTALITLMLALAILMGPSRVVELDHWPADTLGSYLLSIPFLLALIWIDRHPATHPGGWIHGIAMWLKSYEESLWRRLPLGRH